MTKDTQDDDRRALDGRVESNALIDRDGNEAIDRAISAAMDDTLPPEEFDALRERIAAEPEVAARVRAFHAIDAGIRRLADEALAGADSTARAEAGFADLQARLARERRVAWLRRGAPVIAALAAAAALIFLLRTDASNDAGSPAIVGVDGSPIDLVEPAFDELLAGELEEDLDSDLDPDVEAELSVALGYGDQIDILPDVRVEDLEVVDQLDLLDFLAQQDKEGRG